MPKGRGLSFTEWRMSSRTGVLSIFSPLLSSLLCHRLKSLVSGSTFFLLVQHLLTDSLRLFHVNKQEIMYKFGYAKERNSLLPLREIVSKTVNQFY